MLVVDVIDVLLTCSGIALGLAMLVSLVYIIKGMPSVHFDEGLTKERRNAIHTATTYVTVSYGMLMCYMLIELCTHLYVMLCT